MQETEKQGLSDQVSVRMVIKAIESGTELFPTISQDFLIDSLTKKGKKKKSQKSKSNSPKQEDGAVDGEGIGKAKTIHETLT